MIKKLQERWTCQRHSKGPESPTYCYSPAGGSVCYSLTHCNITLWAAEIIGGTATIDDKPSTIHFHDAKPRTRTTPNVAFPQQPEFGHPMGQMGFSGPGGPYGAMFSLPLRFSYIHHGIPLGIKALRLGTHLAQDLVRAGDWNLSKAHSEVEVYRPCPRLQLHQATTHVLRLHFESMSIYLKSPTLFPGSNSLITTNNATKMGLHSRRSGIF
jgi:hypothetical protein